jgi:pimeloyl-ACP methyl ester carboxylesterase
MDFCQNALLNEMNKLNLFNMISTVDVPLHFIHGTNDGISPYNIAISFYNYINAKQKEFITFANSAHMPHYDESNKFAKILIAIKLSLQ